MFCSCMKKLELIAEFPNNNKLRFLDLELFLSDHSCRQYALRSKKSLLPYISAHFKLAKHAIAKCCLGAALLRLCFHTMRCSFNSQFLTLQMEGYLDNLLSTIAECLLADLKQPRRDQYNNQKE